MRGVHQRRAIPAALLAAAVSTAAGCGGSAAPSGPPAGQHASAAAAGRASASSHPPPVPRTQPTAALPTHALLHAPALDQLPELPNGCEVTSLAMLLGAVGRPVSKLTLARMMPTDPTPPVLEPGESGFYAVREWGDPEVGFVGSVTGHGMGYGIYHRPLARLLDEVLPGRALDLTGHPFEDLLREVARGRPVLVWDTTTFAPTDDWVVWRAHGRPVRATTYEHAVLLVGYDRTHVYVNNPLTGAAAQQVDRAAFVAAWHQLGDQALTVR